jgi:hypothetical protein
LSAWVIAGRCGCCPLLLHARLRHPGNMRRLVQVNETHDLMSLVQQATREMADEYERIRTRAKEDPGTAGDAGEENWAELLRRWLPATLHVVTKGRIITSNGKTSPQIDVLILSSSYPRGLLNKKLYLAAGVLAAFECKNTLRREHIRKAVCTSATIGNLSRQDTSVRHHIIYGLLAHSHGITGKRKPPEEVIGDALAQADKHEVRDPRDCLDFICVADLGTWAVLKGYMEYPDEGEQNLTTSYMGPVDEFMRKIPVTNVNHDPNPIGRLLAGLLKELGENNSEIAAIANYFHDVGLFGIGKGQIRVWLANELVEYYGDSSNRSAK